MPMKNKKKLLRNSAGYLPLTQTINAMVMENLFFLVHVYILFNYYLHYSWGIMALFGENYGTIRGELWHYSGRIMALFGSKSGLRKRKF